MYFDVVPISKRVQMLARLFREDPNTKKQWFIDNNEWDHIVFRVKKHRSGGVQPSVWVNKLLCTIVWHDRNWVALLCDSYISKSQLEKSWKWIFKNLFRLLFVIIIYHNIKCHMNFYGTYWNYAVTDLLPERNEFYIV